MRAPVQRPVIDSLSLAEVVFWNCRKSARIQAAREHVDTHAVGVDDVDGTPHAVEWDVPLLRPALGFLRSSDKAPEHAQHDSHRGKEKESREQHVD
jgi:hypothetical protein